MAPPSVLFVCVRNGGKSQMAAALMNAAADGDVVAHSAGTDPGAKLNTLSVHALAEIGVDMSTGRPKPIDPDLIRDVDVVISLGREAQIDAPPEVTVHNWDTDEPSERHIDGIERMRLVRDDIARRVQTLITELTEQAEAEQRGSEATSLIETDPG
jgi:arsenate-mycothiol transferase